MLFYIFKIFHKKAYHFYIKLYKICSFSLQDLNQNYEYPARDSLQDNIPPLNRITWLPQFSSEENIY